MSYLRFDGRGDDVVGVVSVTLARHVVQVAPVVLAIGLVRWRPATGAWVAVPVFAVWGVVMAAIWLYLLGLSDVAAGTYSALEIVLTIVIAACSAWGVRKSVQAGRSLPSFARVAAMLGGLALQASFMAVSFRFFA